MKYIPDAQRRRLMRAIDTNPVLCERCGVKFFDHYDLVLADLAGARDGKQGAGMKEPLRLAACKTTDGSICEGYVAYVALNHGVRAASRLRKVMLVKPKQAN